MSNNNPSRINKNPLEVDLGWFGSVNSPRQIKASTFFKKSDAVRNGSPEDLEEVDALRSCYQEILNESNLPRVARMVYGIYVDGQSKKTGFVDRIKQADSFGALECQMKSALDEGLITLKEKNGQRIYVAVSDPEFKEASRRLINAYCECKKKLCVAKKQARKIGKELMDVSGSHVVSGRYGGKFYKLAYQFLSEKRSNGQTYVTIENVRVLAGKNPGFVKTGSTYIVGVNLPRAAKLDEAVISASDGSGRRDARVVAVFDSGKPVESQFAQQLGRIEVADTSVEVVEDPEAIEA